MQIAQATGGNCTARAISTMRLALGYKTGLPDNWEMGAKDTYELVSLLGGCFPNEAVLVGCSYGVVKEVAFPDNVKYVGPVMVFGKADGEVDSDDYLIAFSYGAPGVGKSHIVIGSPVIYDSSTFIIYLIVAVSLQNHKEMHAKHSP